MALKVINGNTLMGASGVNHCSGAVGDPGSVAGTVRFWREDATFSDVTIYAYKSETTSYPITTTDYQIECVSGTFTITLPTAIGIIGKTFSIKNSGIGKITVNTIGIQTIDDELNQYLSQYDNLMVMSNGSNWIII